MQQAREPNKTATITTTTNNIPSDAPPTPPYNNNSKRLAPLTENTGSIEGNQAVNEPADNRSSRFGLRKRVKGVVSSVPGGQFADQFAQRVATHADQVASQVTTRVGSLPSQITTLPGQVVGLSGNVFNTFTGRQKVAEDEQSIPEEEMIEHSYKLQFPQPLLPAEPKQLVKGLQLNALKYLVIAAVICYFVGRLNAGYIVGLFFVGAGIMAYWVFGTETREGLDWQLEKMEGAKTLREAQGETVEWLNYMLDKIWRSIDPSIFVMVEDILEDALQSVAPALVKGVKVTDFDLGVHAPRVQKIRVFQPSANQPPEAIFGEASFIFEANPVASSSSVRNIQGAPPGIAIRFKTGLKAPVDIKAELTKFRGKLRFKILTSPDMPFVSKVSVSFIKPPSVETGVMPMSKHLNVMRLPMMQSIVNEAVKLGFAGLVDPKSMTVDVQELMNVLDTEALGVIKVEIRKAERSPTITNLEDMEDAYGTVNISTRNKFAPSTRVLTNDEDPRWNENLYVLVYEEDIASDATLDVKVWDADKVKPDDEWGCHSTPIRDIVRAKLDDLGNILDWDKEERVIFDGWAPLDGKPTVEESETKLSYRMTFHPKYFAAPPDSLMTRLQKKSEEVKRLEKEEWNPIHKCGILSVQVAEAADLEIADPEMLADDDLKHPYSHNQIVNPYAVLYINDHKVYESRAKLRNSSPHWNAISEHFVKDYDTTFLRISVKASMDLERDPVLGTRVFYLSDMFVDQQDKYKEAEKWVALANGIGFGKVLMNLKYKPVKLSLPRELQGSDVGTMIIEHVRFVNLKPPFSTDHLRFIKAMLSLNVDPVIMKRLKTRDLHNENGEIVWSKRPMYFPLTMRYRTALYVNVQQGSLSSSKAMGRLWLKTVCDGSWQDATIGLYDPLSEKECNKNEDDWSPDDAPYGQMKIRFMILPGFSPVHTNLRHFRMDMLGADPFRDETLRNKARQLIEEEEAQQEEEAHRGSQATELSDVYGDEQEENDENNSTLQGEEDAEQEYLKDLRDYNKPYKIPRLFVLRKAVRGTDFVRSRVEKMRDGFNSEARASRTVAKE